MNRKEIEGKLPGVPWTPKLREIPTARLERIERAVKRECSLAEIRKDLKISQKELAQRSGTSQSHISSIEQGEDLLLSTLKKVVEALDGRLEITIRLGREAIPLDVAGKTA